MLDQEEARQRRAGHGADGVEPVQQRERPFQLTTVGTHERTGEHREGAAHEGGGNEEHERGEPKPQRHAGGLAERERPGNPEVESMRDPEHEWGDQPEGGDGDLQHTVQRGRPGMAVRAAPEEPRTQPETAHVGGYHSRHRLDGRAEGLVEHPDPQQLVDQTGGSRQEKQQCVSAGRRAGARERR